MLPAGLSILLWEALGHAHGSVLFCGSPASLLEVFDLSLEPHIARRYLRGLVCPEGYLAQDGYDGFEEGLHNSVACHYAVFLTYPGQLP